jgi:hypothetical protein
MLALSTLRCRGCRRKGLGVVSIKWRGQGARPSRGWRSPRCPRPDTRARGKERHRVGDHLDAAPHSGLARPDR